MRTRFVSMLVVCSFLAVTALAGDSVLSIRRVSTASDPRLEIKAINVSLAELLGSLQLHLSKPLEVDVPKARRVKAFDLRGVSAEEALRRIVKSENLMMISDSEKYIVRAGGEPKLTLDVKNVALGDILSEVKRQCGIRNIILAPGVTGEGTFLFEGVPCSSAIKTIFGSLSLQGRMEPNSVLYIEMRK